MKYKIVTSNSIKEVSLGEISSNLGIHSEIYSLSDGETYLGMISHKTLVFFAVEFAEYALQNYANNKSTKAKKCISLARKWIEDDTSISKEEVRAAATAAIDATNAADATDAAIYAVYAADAADAAAADAAVYTVYAAADAAYAAKEDNGKEFIRQGEFILDFLKSGNQLFLV